MPDDIRAACCLSDAELRKREATLIAQFKSALIATEELPHGYAFFEAAEIGERPMRHFGDGVLSPFAAAEAARNVGIDGPLFL